MLQEQYGAICKLSRFLFLHVSLSLCLSTWPLPHSFSLHFSLCLSTFIPLPSRFPSILPLSLSFVYSCQSCYPSPLIGQFLSSGCRFCYILAWGYTHYIWSLSSEHVSAHVLDYYYTIWKDIFTKEYLNYMDYSKDNNGIYTEHGFIGL